MTTIEQPAWLDEYLSIARAALAEAGHDPELVYIRDGQAWWRGPRTLADAAWRAQVIASHAVHRTVRCRECFMAAQASGCESDSLFLDDCGRDR